MPTLVIRHPDGNESEHEFSGELKVGRQEGNDLVLPEGGVSRKHARFWLEDGKVLVEDMGSANGIFVDGERITGPVPLTSRSQVLLGDYALRLKAPARPASASGARRAVKPSGAEPDAPPRSTRAMPSLKAKQAAGDPSALSRRPRPGGPKAPAAEGEDEESAPPVLKGLTGPWANQKFPVEGKLLVGRQEPAAVVLDDDSVSRRHAEVALSPEGVVLRDLGSANGTLVNGEPAGTEPVVLLPGDVVQFGMVELVLEGAAGSSLAPVRRGRGGEPPSRRGSPGGAAAGGAEAPAAAGSRKKLLVVAASVVGLLLVAGIAKSMGGGASPAEANAAPPPPNPVEQVQELLSKCRSHSSSEMGGEPDWAKAEETCAKALDLDPIHTEANALMRRIKLEKEASEYFAQGQRALARLKEEEALDIFGKIPEKSSYFRRAKPKVMEAVAQVMKKAGEDCKLYLRDNELLAAVPRCERYMGFACQKMSTEELTPPIGYKLVLNKRRRLRRNEWRPKNKLYLDFLIARQRLNPDAPPWECPESSIFRGDETGPDPKVEVQASFKKRYPHPFMVAGMLDYWSGRGTESFATLQKLRSNYDLAQYHGQTDDLLKDVSTVDQLFKLGQSHLQKDDPEKAAEPFQEALDVDKRLMAELAESRPSFFRRNIQQDMATKAITSGKYWDDRGDGRRACRIWKLGFSFYTGNTDLNFQVGRCSTRALKAFKAATSCGDLDTVMDLAVPGDGMEAKVKQMRADNGC